MKILKTTLLLALTSIIMIGCAINSTSSEYGREAYKRKLYGDVKILEESNFSILKEHDPEKHLHNINGSDIFTYNENNDIVKHEYRNNKGELERTSTYLYDESGNQIKYQTQAMKPTIDTVLTVRKYWTKSTYDADNNNVEQQHYVTENDSTKLTSRSTLQYDQNNNVIKETHYSDNVIDLIELYKYDNQNRLIEDIAKYGHSNSIYRKTLYKYYDNKEDLTQFTDDEELRTVTFTHDSNGNIIEAYWNHVNDVYPNFTYKSKYDKHDNIIDYIKYNEAGEITEIETLTYKYDKHNNWVERIEYRNKIPTDITIREIIYY